MKFLERNWILIGIAAALGLGVLIPEVGIRINRGSVASTSLTMLMFLIAGLNLPSESILKRLATIRLHVFVQLFIFVVTPLYFVATGRLVADSSGDSLLIGLYALACLPTTIVSCVIFTQAAEGNVTATMFNSAFANVAGVFLSPILLSLMLQSTGDHMPIEELVAILRSLSLKMVVPIAVGQLIRRFALGWIKSRKRILGNVSKTSMLTILFFAFSSSAADPQVADQIRGFLIPIIYIVVSHLVLVAAAVGGAKLLGLSRDDIITVVFAAPQKTLAMGVPLLTTYFGTESGILGPALLPLIVYHIFQLLVAGIIVRVAAGKGESTEA